MVFLCACTLVSSDRFRSDRGFIGSALFGVLIVYLYYIVGKILFQYEAAGLSAAFIKAIGCYAISADWSMIPSHASDAAILVVWYLLF